MVKFNFIKTFTINILLILLSLQVNAKKVDSYIITNNHDTIYGAIRLSRFNLLHKTISLNSYHMEDLFDHVFFRSSTDNKFRELLPMDIIEYGFILERIKYRYISREIKPSWGRNKKRFHLQITYGDINVFEIQIFINNERQNRYPYGMRISEYFILGEDQSLISVGLDDKNKSVAEFLLNYLKLDKEILHKVAYNKTFKDIIEIALLYNKQVSQSR